MAQVILKRVNIERILNGHPWVFDNEIERVTEPVVPGEIVVVVDYKGKFIGRGFINPTSKIRVRLLTRATNERIDAAFIESRMEEAWEYRKRIMDTTSLRIIYSEADGLPGLIVDKFGEYLVIQTLSLGIDRFKDVIVRKLIEMIAPRGIYERNDAPVRRLEGLEEKKGVLWGDFAPVQCFEENGLRFWIDMENGQKTGYFLDQKENRLALKPYVKGGRVLDCFCDTGSFSIHSAVFGAVSVEGVDISPEALKLASKNAELNGVVDKCTFKEANVFDLLKEYDLEGRRFDAIILDPPAFAKSSKALENAIRGYKEINLRAMRLLTPGGFLITSSCSQHLSQEDFLDVIKDAARDTRKRLRLAELRGQSRDHPVLPASKETSYLKFAIFEVR